MSVEATNVVLFVLLMTFLTLEAATFAFTVADDKGFNTEHIGKMALVFGIIFSVCTAPMIATGPAPDMIEWLFIVTTVINVVVWLSMEHISYKKREKERALAPARPRRGMWDLED